jgi:xanthine dehydrogenase iron-sulfur cluster and FAD-binding subunit A
MWRDYFIPESLEAALDLLKTHAPDGARIIAGGTDLIVEFDRGARKPCPLIDISRLPGLADITLGADGVIRLGALVTHGAVAASALCNARAWPLAQACHQVGAPQIRNRATLAGNLVTASPANDAITPLIALGAAVTLRSVRGERSVALAAFYTGVRKTVMQPDELLVDITFPALPADARGAYLKLGLRRAQAISVVNCCVLLYGAAQKITDARITLGAVAPTILRATAAEAALQGQALDETTIAQAALLAQQAATPISDIRASATYRRDMVAVLVRRALRGALSGVQSTAAGERRTEDRGRPTGHAQSAMVNGVPRAVAPAAEHKTVLRWLREDCDLTGTKEGCAEGECGACTVLLDGKAVMACLVPAPRARGAVIETIESLAANGALHPLQQAFIDAGAVQCGYCTPGLLMSGAELFADNPAPSDAQIKEAISGNLCRCTGYYKIIEAFQRARVAVGH